MATLSFAGCTGLVLLLLQLHVRLATGLALDLCASINTSNMNKNVSMVQTNGLCHDFCIANYAFAITQDHNCWCSNTAPAESAQVDLSECSTACPAYPVEHCGGPDVFGYVVLPGHLPAGTEGASAPSSTSSSEAGSTEGPTSEPPSSTSTQPPTSAPTTMVQTVTAGGKVTTVTVGFPTSAPTNANSSGDAESVKSKGGLGTGSIVGIVVGVIALVLAIAGLALVLFLRRRKRNQQTEYQDDPSVRGGSSGRLDIQHQDMSGIVPASPGSAGNRSSVLHIDPRMDPFKQGLYIRSTSNESINTLRDDHDYSRRIQPPAVLRATNPDPEDS